MNSSVAAASSLAKASSTVGGTAPTTAPTTATTTAAKTVAAPPPPVTIKPSTTETFLKDFTLVAEAAKRAQVAVMMRDFENVGL